MSKAPFLECVSEDPVIKALARQAVRLLNDPSLDRQQREVRVRKVQSLLLDHPASVARKAATKATGSGPGRREALRLHGKHAGCTATARQVSSTTFNLKE